MEDQQRERLRSWHQELQGCYKTMTKLNDMDVSDVFRHLSQFSARACEMRHMLGPNEDRLGQQFRIRTIEPFIDECDRQFRVHSRKQAVNEMDAKLAGGRFA